MKKRICIISLTQIERDARVLRQIKYLSKNYNLTVIGLGNIPNICCQTETIKWIEIGKYLNVETEGTKIKDKISRLRNRIRSGDYNAIKRSILYRLGPLGRNSITLCKFLYWNDSVHTESLKYALQSQCEAYLANDWDSLPIAGEAAVATGGKLVFDAHEYALGQVRNLNYKKKKHPIIKYVLSRYSPRVDAFVTVGNKIGERYFKEYNLSPTIIRNAPDYFEIEPHDIEFSKINIVHHGIPSPRRYLENYIKAVSLANERFQLHFFLINTDRNYIERLKKLAIDIAPGRVHFHQPVKPSEIIPTISKYDIGICVFPPVTYNLKMVLPNKFFDYFQAGLAVITGPSPEIQLITKEYKLGAIAHSFSPSDVAEKLNELTIEEIKSMRKSARKAAKEINAEKELLKLCQIFERLFKLKPKPIAIRNG